MTRLSRCATIFMCFIPAAMGGCDFANCTSPESSLRTTFIKNIEILEKLRAMSDEDKSVIRIAPTFTRLENDWNWPRPIEKLGFSESRWNVYRRPFIESELPDGLEREGSSITFTAKACGLGISGKSFGYAFFPEKPSITIKNFDEQQGEGIGYVPIQGNWYLFVWAG